MHRAFCAAVQGVVLVAALATPLAMAAGPASAAASPDSLVPRLSRDATPTHQSVELTLDPGREDYQGRTIVSLAVSRPIDELRFHARALTIDSVSVRGPKGAVAVKEIERLAPDQARIRLGAPCPPGDYTLTMRFHNRYNTRAVALYRVVNGGDGYLFTQLEDTEAREAFPCWDEPEFKIPWTMRVVILPACFAATIQSVSPIEPSWPVSMT